MEFKKVDAKCITTAFFTTDVIDGKAYSIMAEYEGSLINLFQKPNKQNSTFTYSILYEILFFVDLLHKNKIQHRDLKFDNFLYDNKENIKVSDFGLSCYFNEKDCLGTSGYTPFYAPYDLKNNSIYVNFPKLFDYYSIGMMFVALRFDVKELIKSDKLLTIETMKKIRILIENDQKLDKELKNTLYRLLRMPKRCGSGWSTQIEEPLHDLNSFYDGLENEIYNMSQL